MLNKINDNIINLDDVDCEMDQKISKQQKDKFVDEIENVNEYKINLSEQLSPVSISNSKIKIIHEIKSELKVVNDKKENIYLFN